MTDRTTDDQPTVGVLNFWSFIELANKRLATEHGFRDQLATEVLLTLNRASNVVTYDLESSIHRPRGWSWSSFRLLFVTWLAGPIEPKAAAELTGMRLLVLATTYVVKRFTHDQATRAIVVSYYWHFVDVVWIAIFTLVYLVP